MSCAIDDRTAAYIIESQPIFEDLRQVAGQVAGLLILAASGSKEWVPDHPMLVTAAQVFAHSADALARSRAPAGEDARAHHRCLVDARTALGHALSFARAWPIDIDAVMMPLRDAYSALQRASRLLPGFQIVSFERACCSVTRAQA
jgi:hypothetical protein